MWKWLPLVTLILSRSTCILSSLIRVCMVQGRWQIRFIQWSVSGVSRKLGLGLVIFVRRVVRVIPLVTLRIIRSQHRESFGESSAISCNCLSLVSKWKFFPDCVVYGLALHIDKVFFARSTLHRPKWFSWKHGLIHTFSMLFGKHFENFSDLFAQLGKSFHHFVTVGKIIQHVFYVG